MPWLGSSKCESQTQVPWATALPHTASLTAHGDCVLQAAESENHSLSQELQRVRVKSQQAALEADKLQKKVDDLQHFSELERQVRNYIEPCSL